MKAAMSAPSRVYVLLSSECLHLLLSQTQNSPTAKYPYYFAATQQKGGGKASFVGEHATKNMTLHFYDKGKFSSNRQILRFKRLNRVVPRYRIPSAQV